MIIAVDFDGTLVEHKYPDIGNEVPYAFRWLQNFQDAGAKLILYTMRCGPELDAAVEYCRNRGIEFWGVNENPTQKEWTSSQKVFAHVYIDDASACVPKSPAKEYGLRECVDWEVVGEVVYRMITEEAIRKGCRP